MRLQKYLSRCGIASRRSSEKLILEGRVSINDKVVTKMGTKVNLTSDVVKFDGKIIKPQKFDITLILNKPAGYVSTMHDPQDRPCLNSLVPIDKFPSLFPVGRLDRLTCGLLIFTTDGNLGQTLLHPKHEVSKEYLVVIDNKLNKCSDSYNKLCNGIEIISGKTSPAKLRIHKYFNFNEYLKYENEFFKNSATKNDQAALPKEKTLINRTFTLCSIEIHEGKNRQVRRMFEAVGFEVLLLKRIRIGNLKLDNLECGKWRKLNKEEIELMLNE